MVGTLPHIPYSGYGALPSVSPLRRKGTYATSPQEHGFPERLLTFRLIPGDLILSKIRHNLKLVYRTRLSEVNILNLQC